jgi:hypothetical protein
VENSGHIVGVLALLEDGLDRRSLGGLLLFRKSVIVSLSEFGCLARCDLLAVHVTKQLLVEFLVKCAKEEGGRDDVGR